MTNDHQIKADLINKPIPNLKDTKPMTRLFDLLYNQLNTNPLEASLSARDADGNWKSYSTEDVKNYAEQAASGLVEIWTKARG